MRNPRIATLVQKVRGDWPDLAVSAYSGPLSKPHVQLIVVSPHGKIYTARFYNHGQYAWFMRAQDRAKRGGDASRTSRTTGKESRSHSIAQAA